MIKVKKTVLFLRLHCSRREVCMCVKIQCVQSGVESPRTRPRARSLRNIKLVRVGLNRGTKIITIKNTLQKLL